MECCFGEETWMMWHGMMYYREGFVQLPLGKKNRSGQWLFQVHRSEIWVANKLQKIEWGMAFLF